jgi:hypothetical protein
MVHLYHHVFNLRQTLRRWTTSTGIGGPFHRNTHLELNRRRKFVDHFFHAQIRILRPFILNRVNAGEPRRGGCFHGLREVKGGFLSLCIDL